MINLKVKTASRKDGIEIDDAESKNEKAHQARTVDASHKDDGTSRMRQHNAELVAGIYQAVDKLYRVTANMHMLYDTAAKKKSDAVDQKNEKVRRVVGLEASGDAEIKKNARERYEDIINNTSRVKDPRQEPNFQYTDP